MSINVSPHDMPRETTREKQAKEVGRTLYEGILSSQSSVSLSTSNGTINSSMHRPDILSQDALEGLEDGKMSAVRRTFCLFVAFDLILTSVLWIIYTQLIGESPVWKAFRDQVDNYTFELSLFDTVMASAFRFVLLLLTYALFRVRHWWPVAITTFITCVFLLVKCFLFKFSAEKAGSGNSLSYVLLIVPFVIAWVETWFIDFKVLPQEKKAVDALRYVTERTPLVRDEQGFYTQSQQAALDQNQYYSPVNTPDASEDEDEKGFHSARQSRTHSRSASRSSTVSAAEEDYLTSAAEAWDILWEQFRKEDWRLEAGTDPQQGCVKCRHQKGEGKLFMLQGVVEMAAENLFKELVYGINDSPSWNPTILESETLQEVDDCTCVQYSVSAEAAGGIISSRDFINVLRWGKPGSYYMSCGTATTHPDRPPGKKHVRGVNGAGGWVIRPIYGDPSSSEFFWINRTDLKGWLPQGVIDKAMSGFLLDFLKYLRKRVEKLKADGQV